MFFRKANNISQNKVYITEEGRYYFASVKPKKTDINILVFRIFFFCLIMLCGATVSADSVDSKDNITWMK